MRTRITLIICLCLFAVGRASAQWAVIDPSNIGADAAEGEQQGDGDDEPVIRGALVEQQLQEEAEAPAQQKQE